MQLLEGKKALILGVANDKSIAWGITKALKQHGAQVGLSYLNEKLKTRVQPLADEVGADFIFELDVTNEEHYNNMRKEVIEKWKNVDIIIHSLAFANRDDLRRDFSETSREGFALACDVSAFSLIGVSNSLKDLLSPDGSVIAMTYHGAQQVIEGYNVMGVAKAALEATSRYLASDLGKQGVRVNCISSGPIKTLASSAVKNISSFTKVIEDKSPLKRNVTPDDIGGAAVYLSSPLSNNVTGQVLYVDSGISIMGA
ncbi:enoyl-ACP reductase [Bacteriovoracales bacterium]|nr:enoyl-ACP reductase [Bacteriovoracales bacterium]